VVIFPGEVLAFQNTERQAHALFGGTAFRASPSRLPFLGTIVGSSR
jgi:hypothetical protein